MACIVLACEHSHRARISLARGYTKCTRQRESICKSTLNSAETNVQRAGVCLAGQMLWIPWVLRLCFLLLSYSSIYPGVPRVCTFTKHTLIMSFCRIRSGCIPVREVLQRGYLLKIVDKKQQGLDHLHNRRRVKRGDAPSLKVFHRDHGHRRRSFHASR